MSAASDTAAMRREQYRLSCGCVVDILRDRVSAVTLSRTIARRATACRSRSHQPGARVYLWELLPAHRAVTGGYR